MAKGSQLSQLKSALSQAGLARQSQPSGSAEKKRKRAGNRDTTLDRDKKARKLDEINQKLNPFEVKVTKLKHDVGGRKLKGVTGRPGLSKQVGIDQVRVYQDRNITSYTYLGFVDSERKRFLSNMSREGE